MEKKTIVVALGREAFGAILPEQKNAVKKAAIAIADLVEAKHNVVITHSNGTQLGMIHKAMNEFSQGHPAYTAAPMSVCGALSQGYIGYDLQNAIRTELLNRGIFKTVSTIITQVRVDPFDPAFNNPSKVIGRILTKDEADAEVKKGNYVVEVEGGYRRIFATPKPIDIYEIDAIKALTNAGQIVIACGGGGIPVLEQGTRLQGASAVIEKDYATLKLAQMLDADEILFLTGIENIYLNYGKENEMALTNVTSDEVKTYIEDGQFPATSILPKMQAAVEFVEGNPDRRVVITHLSKAKEGLLGKCGTIVKA